MTAHNALAYKKLYFGLYILINNTILFLSFYTFSLVNHFHFNAIN